MRRQEMKLYGDDALVGKDFTRTLIQIENENVGSVSISCQDGYEEGETELLISIDDFATLRRIVVLTPDGDTHRIARVEV